MRTKLEQYSLAIRHESGGPKAYLFKQLPGITIADVDHLEAAIRAGVTQVPVGRVHRNPPHGVGCQVLIPVRGVGVHHTRVMVVTTGWELRYVGDRPRLVSAYIKGSRSG